MILPSFTKKTGLLFLVMLFAVDNSYVEKI